MLDGRGFFLSDKEVFHSNPGGLQGKPTRYGGKKTAQTAFSDCEYRFLYGKRWCPQSAARKRPQAVFLPNMKPPLIVKQVEKNQLILFNSAAIHRRRWPHLQPLFGFIENKACFTRQRAAARWLKTYNLHVFNFIHYTAVPPGPAAPGRQPPDASARRFRRPRPRPTGPDPSAPECSPGSPRRWLRQGYPPPP